jgi:hypothetical protein
MKGRSFVRVCLSRFETSINPRGVEEAHVLLTYILPVNPAFNIEVILARYLSCDSTTLGLANPFV